MTITRHVKDVTSKARVTKRGFIGLLFFLIISLIFSLAETNAQTARVPEAAGKTAMVAPEPTQTELVSKTVLGILSFSIWPSRPPPDTLRLCVIPPVVYAAGLVSSNKNITGKTLEVSTQLLSNAKLSSSCDAIYSGLMTTEQQRDLYDSISGHPVLTLSENDDACALANAFCLIINPGHIDFKLNRDTLSRSGVRVNPNVLQLAREKED
ncbi:YfiR family protein [Rahnella sp. SAP-1]|uniref:YfiR family protein n=1 Tax=Rouxiella aceris TaxID=2703884 RepID=A0A848MK43_9GAMM|nr:YfiR family protein [Rouxiella aceris]NMP27643.1 YfiR family protein [Rouxiella aceris]